MENKDKIWEMFSSDYGDDYFSMETMFGSSYDRESTVEDLYVAFRNRFIDELKAHFDPKEC